MVISRVIEEVFMDLTLDQLIQCHDYHVDYLNYWQNTPFHGVVRELFWMNCILAGWLHGQWTRPQFCYKYMLLKEIFLRCYGDNVDDDNFSGAICLFKYFLNGNSHMDQFDIILQWRDICRLLDFGIDLNGNSVSHHFDYICVFN